MKLVVLSKYETSYSFFSKEFVEIIFRASLTGSKQLVFMINSFTRHEQYV